VGFVSVPAASLIIYPAVIAAWSYVACIGVSKTQHLQALKISTLVLLLAVAFGNVVRWRQEKLLKELG
jgi:hypothetical protein